MHRALSAPRVAGKVSARARVETSHVPGHVGQGFRWVEGGSGNSAPVRFCVWWKRILLSLNYLFWRDETMQIYGKFEGIPL